MSLKIRRALILGGANCVWDDVEAACKLGKFQAIVAVNDVGAEYPEHVDIWCSLHPDKLPAWAKQRADNGYRPAGMLVGHADKKSAGFLDETTPYQWPGMSGSGSSGLFAVKVALEHGYNRVVLCGVPMEKRPHFFKKEPWPQVDSFTAAWKTSINNYSEFTRSMSGWTAELLGKPTKKWLAG